MLPRRKALMWGAVGVWVVIVMYVHSIFMKPPAVPTTEPTTTQQIQKQAMEVASSCGSTGYKLAKAEERVVDLEKQVDELKTLVNALRDEYTEKTTELDNCKTGAEALQRAANRANTALTTRAATDQNDAMIELPKVIIPIRMRNQLGDVCRKERFETGIEIGVSRGQFAQQMLKRWTNFKKYYLIDAWKNQGDTYVDDSNKSDREMQEILTLTRARMNKYGPEKIQFIQKFSNEAVTQFEDNSIDFIYIDARHDYAGVYQDCTLYWPKLKVGGIMAGHDYIDQPEVPPVKGKVQDWTLQGDNTHTVDGKASRSAVEDFSLLVGRQLAITYKDETQNQFPTWYLRK
eukprot:TRINITY_DN93889_c0_g1_i1.p1 TRINITY_DN93889_c0_g1~~TRINITY_DN93889_c0_g1_i1.p1  ORF type:complete len:346 (-),score=36.62 TRINITY_DN93889_c0_g1_i1:338-1375(-)